ncbi:MAG: hypothetical protein NWE92_05060 [Candidatus Bathyarchaeota archaeon]|nr:hypothetical protein [Candidatus Bathyarchaeota archaeon]
MKNSLIILELPVFRKWGNMPELSDLSRVALTSFLLKLHAYSSTHVGLFPLSTLQWREAERALEYQ